MPEAGERLFILNYMLVLKSIKPVTIKSIDNYENPYFMKYINEFYEEDFLLSRARVIIMKLR